MAFTLIPFPISIIVVVLFFVVAELVLWRLRKNGRAYRMFSNIAAVLGVFFTVLFIILLASGL